jgi:energy-coupling factor transport system ATP-binding protein
MGQKRRLSVATMLILNLDTLILDEPTTGQDRKNIDNIMEIMMEVNRRDTTILLITHDMNLVAKYCRRILVMDEGQVVYYGAKGDFCRRFAEIRSEALVLPEIYELTQRLRQGPGLPAPELFTVDEFVAAAKVL